MHANHVNIEGFYVKALLKIGVFCFSFHFENYNIRVLSYTGGLWGMKIKY
jgi:hypothetical protein